MVNFNAMLSQRPCQFHAPLLSRPKRGRKKNPIWNPTNIFPKFRGDFSLYFGRKDFMRIRKESVIWTSLSSLQRKDNLITNYASGSISIFPFKFKREPFTKCIITISHNEVYFYNMPLAEKIHKRTLHLPHPVDHCIFCS
jgi:hypothetical protein